VQSLLDIRSFPGSRRHPHMSREAMATWVPEAGVTYRWEPRLGGRRKPVAGSPHVALRNRAFRAYADHMMSAEFRAGLHEVLATAGPTRTAVMCAETLWWRCHRRLTADAATLLAGVEVLHVMHDGTLAAHVPTEGVRREDNQLIYDVGAERPLPL
jgi:uncharacterized protein (DUF488 family)